MPEKLPTGSEPITKESLPGESLTPQERTFAFRYLVDYNHSNAAEAAGYSRHRGINLLRDPRIREFIGFLQADVERTSLISKALVEHEILHVALPRAKGDEAVSEFVPGMGISVTTQRYDASSHLRIIDMMAKHSGYIAPLGNEKKRPVIINFDMSAMVGETKQVGVVIDGELDDNAA